MICLTVTGCATTVKNSHVPLATLGYPQTPTMPKEQAKEIAEALGKDKALDIAGFVMTIHEVYRARIDRLNKLIEEHNKLHRSDEK